MIRHLSNSLHSAVVKLMKTWGFIFYFLNYTVTAVTSPTAALFPPPSLLRWCHTVVCGVSVVSLWSVVCLWLHCGLWCVYGYTVVCCQLYIWQSLKYLTQILSFYIETPTPYGCGENPFKHLCLNDSFYSSLQTICKKQKQTKKDNCHTKHGKKMPGDCKMFPNDWLSLRCCEHV